MSARRLDWRTALLLAVSFPLGCLLTILLLELYTHWRLDLGHRFHDVNTRFDSELGWATIEGRSIDTSAGRLTSNTHGFRSREIDPGARHVIVLGDSVTWGWGVADAETFPWRLDRLWAPAGVQVSNLAVAGYGLDQYYLSLEKHHALFRDLRAVIAVITTADDLKSTSGNTAFGKRKPLFELRDGQLVEVQGPIRHYGLRNLISRSTFLMYMDSSPIGPALRSWLDPLAGDRTLPREEALAVGRALLRAMAGRAAARGARFALVLVPARMDFPEPGTDQRWFASLCGNEAFACLDFREPLARERDLSALYLDDVHLNAAGLALLAGSVAEALGPGLSLPPRKS